MGLGKFIKNNAGLIGSVAGSIVAPGIGTAIGGAIGNSVANSGGAGGGQFSPGKLGPGIGQAGLASVAQESLNPNFGVNQFSRIAANSAGSISTLEAQAAQRGLSRQAGTAIAGRQFEANRRRGASDAINALAGFQLSARGQALGALGQLAAIDAQAQEARKERRASFLNNVLSVGSTFAGSHFGGQGG